jgi:hypothetical protein
LSHSSSLLSSASVGFAVSVIHMSWEFFILHFKVSLLLAITSGCSESCLSCVPLVLIHRAPINLLSLN